MLALITTGAVDAGCGGSETLHCPPLEAVATTLATTLLAAPDFSIATVTAAPGAAHPQMDAGCGARCRIIESV